MGHSQSSKEKNRARIIEKASRKIRADGLDALSVREVMNEAGLTHGGFYKHFSSSGELIEEAIAFAFEESTGVLSRSAARDRKDLAGFLGIYLSALHRDHPSAGCAVATLGVDVGRRESAGGTAMSSGIKALVRLVASHLGVKSDDQALSDGKVLTVTCAMVGALCLARAVKEREYSDHILNSVAEELVEAFQPVP